APVVFFTPSAAFFTPSAAFFAAPPVFFAEPVALRRGGGVSADRSPPPSAGDASPVGGRSRSGVVWSAMSPQHNALWRVQEGLARRSGPGGGWDLCRRPPTDGIL